MANPSGTNRWGGLLGGGQIVWRCGEVVARAGRADVGEPPEPELLVATLDLRRELRRAERDHGALWKLRRPEVYGSG